MKRHAYLIIAHNEPRILEVLLQMLDVEWNDIYLHIDKRNMLLNERMQHFPLNKARLFLLKKPISVYWGHTSQVEVEFLLLRTASQNGPYTYYHLLSGCDLPLKSQTEIHDFFQKNEGREFIAYWNSRNDKKDALRKVRYYYIFNRYKKRAPFLLHTLTTPIRNILLIAQKAIGLNRFRKCPLEIKKGSNWFSITEKCCQYVLSREKQIKSMFRYTLCPDEIFLHTIVWNSPFRKHLYNVDDTQAGAMRAIDWQRGNPYIWRKGDVDTLLRSPYLFARKFSSSELEAVQLLSRKISQK